MNYIISSYGRPEHQKTLESLPAQCLSQVELWVRPEELKLYKKQWYSSKVKTIRVWEPEIDCIAKKRKYLGDEYRKTYTLIDDDLTLYVWDPKLQKYVRAVDSEKRFIREFTHKFPSLFDDYQSASIPMKLFSDQRAKQLQDVNLVAEHQIGYVFSGYKKNAMRNLSHKVFVFTDLSLSLQQYQKTRSSVVYYGMCFQQSSAKVLATTGVGTYRSDFVKTDAALKMMKLYPGIVVDFKPNKEENGGGISIVKRLARIRKGITQSHKDESKANLRLKLKENGLKRTPARFEIEYDVSRDEIIEQLKRNWKDATK